MSELTLSQNQSLQINEDARAVSQRLAQELSKILSAKITEQEKEIEEKLDEKEAELRSGVTFIETVFYVAVFAVPVAMLFFIFGDAIQAYLQENVFSQFQGDSTSTPQTNTGEKGDSIPNWILFIPAILLLYNFIKVTLQARKEYKLKAFLMDRAEYNTRKDALEKVTEEMVAEDAKGAALSTLRDLYAIHDHINQNPEVIQTQKDHLVNVYGQVLLAGQMVGEIDDYQNTREEVHKINQRRPHLESSQKQAQLDSELHVERTELLEHLDDIAQHVSLLRGEMLQLESNTITQKTLQAHTNEYVSQTVRASENLDQAIQKTQTKLS